MARTHPVFNHIAMSVPAELLSQQNISDILSFYGVVFGWTEMPTTTVAGERIILRVHSNEQFVFLHASDEPMRCPAMDHYGMSVASPEDLDSCVERARKIGEADDRVIISERATEDFGMLKLHSVYIRYLLPMCVELQCFEWAKGAGAQGLPS